MPRSIIDTCDRIHIAPVLVTLGSSVRSRLSKLPAIRGPRQWLWGPNGLAPSIDTMQDRYQRTEMSAPIRKSTCTD
jgi:hypothetical protein